MFLPVMQLCPSTGNSTDGNTAPPQRAQSWPARNAAGRTRSSVAHGTGERMGCSGKRGDHRSPQQLMCWWLL